jgi:hypothetical protein
LFSKIPYKNSAGNAAGDAGAIGFFARGKKTFEKNDFPAKMRISFWPQ